MEYINVECCICGRRFDRYAAEVKRSERLERRTCCSRKCSGIANASNLPKPTADSAKHLNPGNKLDEFSPFRSHLKTAKMHAKQTGKEFDLKVEDLKQQWEKQNGKCIYSGWNLDNPSSTSVRLERCPTRASLDRIDSSKGYVAGNVQFVCMIANYAKNDFPEIALFSFCEAVTNRRKGNG